MANLDDLKQALDRIYERLGQQAPQKAADALSPQPKTTVEKDKEKREKGEAQESNELTHVLSNAFSRVPVLRDIIKQLTLLNSLFKGQTAATVSNALKQQVPFVGPLALAKKRREIEGEYFKENQWAELMSKNPATWTPAREAAKKKWVNNKLAEEAKARADAEKKDKDPEFDKWKETLSPSGSIAQIRKVFGKGGGAIGNIFKQLGKDFNVLSGGAEKALTPEQLANPKYLAALEAASQAAVADVFLVAGSLALVGVGLVKFGKGINDANRGLAGFSGLMSLSYAMADMQQMFRDMNSANARAGSTAHFNEAWSRFMDRVQPMLDTATNVVQDTAAYVLDAVGVVADNAGADVGGSLMLRGAGVAANKLKDWTDKIDPQTGEKTGDSYLDFLSRDYSTKKHELGFFEGAMNFTNPANASRLDALDPGRVMMDTKGYRRDSKEHLKLLSQQLQSVKDYSEDSYFFEHWKDMGMPSTPEEFMKADSAHMSHMDELKARIADIKAKGADSPYYKEWHEKGLDAPRGEWDQPITAKDWYDKERADKAGVKMPTVPDKGTELNPLDGIHINGFNGVEELTDAINDAIKTMDKYYLKLDADHNIRGVGAEMFMAGVSVQGRGNSFALKDRNMEIQHRLWQHFTGQDKK